MGIIVKDSNSREVELEVSGDMGDAIEIDSATYLDSNAEVPDSEIDYIYNKYSSELEEALLDRLISAADFYERD